ncbi:MAG: acetyl/propionyl/methylcrotonyl-CoA carboxylase subunit alpha [Pseudomonadales bacterium]|nr:acetyl/propionyl/methylcrotonyl-CoA carboxylase subunit alpha [Pseudomonadales bacterium]
MFTKILIANRGEIACRVIKTAHRMGIATVAVYSDADREALHVRMADEAVHIGAAPARESYLLAERILEAALATGAQAIHPGYGFLSENAAFARACAERGVVFIGPPAAAIEAMGSKSAAKRIMEQAQVPLVPGYHGDDQDPAVLRAAADEMGYPVLLKATAGGGGKGMRQVWSAAEFDAALAAAQREAAASFGDDSMLVEKYLTKPRHVEIQVFCDNAGSGVYLAERDCSVQRRHQKVIEEAPAPGMSGELRRRMGETAVTAAQAIDYRGAGTVEFLLDEDGSFYFMEMNTRLQVEHPVTEMITGQDLVEWQLRVAAGQPLPLAQEQVRIHGHAFEARVYAEDPDNDFLPVTGTLSYLQPPDESLHVRVDTGVRQGDEVSVYYDPMIAKLIVWDESRERALQRLARALAAYRIGGTVTNLDFLYNLATCQPFVEAQLDTGFIDKHAELIFHQRQQDLERELPLAALALLLDKQARGAPRACLDPFSPWQQSNAWRLNEPHSHRLTLHCHGADHPVEVEQAGGGYIVRAAGRELRLLGELNGDTLQLDVEGHRQRGTLARTPDGYTLYLAGGACHFREVLPDTGEADAGGAAGGLAAPMNGTIVALLAEPGSRVEADTPLLVMEAMKMEHTIRAPAAGTVNAFYYQPGDLVDGGAELLDFAAGEQE